MLVKKGLHVFGRCLRGHLRGASCSRAGFECRDAAAGDNATTKAGLGWLLFQEQFRRLRSVGGNRAVDCVFGADGDRGSDQRKFWLQFPVWKFRVRPGRLARGGQLRRQVHRAVFAGNDGRRLDAKYELARHRDWPRRIFGRSVAALRERRLCRRRRKLAVAGRRPGRVVLYARDHDGRLDCRHRL